MVSGGSGLIFNDPPAQPSYTHQSTSGKLNKFSSELVDGVCTPLPPGVERCFDHFQDFFIIKKREGGIPMRSYRMCDEYVAGSIG